MSATTERACAWCGPAFMLLFLVGFGGIAGFIPPPSPDVSAAETARMYLDDTTAIRVGLMVTMFGSALLIPWTVAVALQLRRAEGERAPLTLVFVLSGAMLVLEFLFPVMVWQTAAFRPHGNPETIQHLNDLGWLPLLGLTSTILMQCVVVGIVILKDRSATPVLPRWLGYLSVWAAVGISPASMIIYVKSGPLAWNGLLAWWCVLVAFAIWIVAMTVEVLKALGREARAIPA